MVRKISKTEKSSRNAPDLKAIINRFIEHHQLLQENATIVLGLSGGPDSVFLLHILAELKKHGHIKEIIAAHLNHGWRTDSSQDVAFCQKLASSYGIPFISDHLTTFKNQITWNGSKEDVGRKARRLFFKNVMKEYNADAIALAHHRDDQLETFFIRLMRGASVTGLCGMRPKHGAYIRPLLAISKQEIIDYLTVHTITYLTDPSNSSSDYLRNRIRENVLPVLHSCDARFESNSMRAITHLQEVEDYLVAHTKELFAHMSTQKDSSIIIDFDQLLAQPQLMQYRLLMHWLMVMKVPFAITEKFLQEIIRFLKAKKSTTHQMMDSWMLQKTKKMVMIKNH